MIDTYLRHENYRTTRRFARQRGQNSLYLKLFCHARFAFHLKTRSHFRTATNGNGHTHQLFSPRRRTLPSAERDSSLRGDKPTPPRREEMVRTGTFNDERLTITVYRLPVMQRGCKLLAIGCWLIKRRRKLCSGAAGCWPLAHRYWFLIPNS